MVLEEIKTASYDMVLLDMQNMYFTGGAYRNDTCDIAQRVRDLQPGAIVIGYSVLPTHVYKNNVEPGSVLNLFIYEDNP